MSGVGDIFSLAAFLSAFGAFIGQITDVHICHKRVLQQLRDVFSIIGVFLQAAVNEVLSVQRDVFGEADVIVEGLYFGYYFLVVVAGKGWEAEEHLVDRAPQTPDVSEPLVLGMFDDFGRHPPVGARQRILQVGQLPGCAKVRQLDYSFLVDQHIGTLDVAVNDVVLVQILEPHEDVLGVSADGLFLELLVVVNRVLETVAVDQLHVDVDSVLESAIAVVVDNVGVGQLLQNIFLNQVVAVGFFVFEDYFLDCHRAVVGLVSALVDVTRSALAYHFLFDHAHGLFELYPRKFEFGSAFVAF